MIFRKRTIEATVVNLLLVEIVGKAANEDLLERVRNDGADDSGNTSKAVHATATRNRLQRWS